MTINKLYSFIISPPTQVINDIKGFKNFSESIIGGFISRKSTAHISVCRQAPENPVVMYRKTERLTWDLINIPGVELTLKGFDCFYNKSSGYTIYAKIEMTDYLTNWFKQVKLCFGNRSKTTPHITIARGLSPEQFLLLWPYFQTRLYERKFQVTELTILENNLIKTGPDQIFKQILFGQDHGSLFNPWNLFDHHF